MPMMTTKHLIFVSLLATASLPGQSRLGPQQALSLLKAGNERFAAGESQAKPLGEGLRRSLAQGQKPLAIVLTCADSRVSPEHLFNAGLGELFVIRSAGHTCSPDNLASIEYAVDHLDTSLLVILGHDHCDTVAAALEGKQQTRAFTGILEELAPALQAARQTGLTGDPLARASEKENAHHCLGQCMRQSPLLQQLQQKKEFLAVAAHYDMATGLVQWLPHRPLTAEHGHGEEATPPELPTKVRGMAAHVALQSLQAGHRRFLHHHQASGNISAARRQQLSLGDRPVAIVVTCADSRVPPEHIFDAGLGELTVVRVAGNVISQEVLGSIEHAVISKGANLCIVLGHDQCGAVAAALESSQDQHHSQSMQHLLKQMQPAVERAQQMHGQHDHLALAVEQNALQSVAKIRTGSTVLQQLEAKGIFMVLPAVYELGSGDIRWLKGEWQGEQLAHKQEHQDHGQQDSEHDHEVADHHGRGHADQHGSDHHAGNHHADELVAGFHPAPAFESWPPESAEHEHGHDHHGQTKEPAHPGHWVNVLWAGLITTACMLWFMWRRNRKVAFAELAARGKELNQVKL